MEPNLNSFSPSLSVGQVSPGVYLGSRPIVRKDPKTGKVQMRVNKATGGYPVLVTPRGLQVNSLLFRDEWQLIDTRVQQSALTRLTVINDLRSRGLVTPITSFGTLVVQWPQASEMTAAKASMTGRAISEKDRVENKLAGAPVPIIFKDFDIDTREIAAARNAGMQLDTANATAASRVVAEKAEDMLMNGDSALVFGGYTLYGLTTEPNRKTGTAAGLGGGDWGTLSNVLPTVAGAIALLGTQANRYFGPYVLYVSTVQYTQAATNFYNDGSGDSGITRIKKIPEIVDVRPSDQLADGSMVLVQLSEDVVKWAEHMMVTVVEWMSGDGMTAFFRVMAVGTPVVRSDYGSRSGIAHITGL
jgi:uncharacterized linocin/CFP29 family protein